MTYMSWSSDISQSCNLYYTWANALSWHYECPHTYCKGTFICTVTNRASVLGQSLRRVFYSPAILSYILQYFRDLNNSWDNFMLTLQLISFHLVVLFISNLPSTTQRVWLKSQRSRVQYPVHLLMWRFFLSLLSIQEGLLSVTGEITCT